MRMLSAGPDVSLKGSPTVSPTTVPSKCSLGLVEAELLGVLLGVVPRAAGVGHGDGEHEARRERADEHAGEALGRHEADDHRHEDGDAPGMTISLIAAVVAMAMQRS